jgi:hypothetical protein
MPLNDIIARFQDVNREPLALVVGTSISGARVALELDRLIAAHGASSGRGLDSTA